MTHTTPTTADREVIRRLAGRWAEIAALPVMAERKRQWRALHDLRPERPMVLFETATVYEYVAPEELRCEHPVLRAVEAVMRENIRHFDEIGDDVVLEPYYRLGWDLVTSSWGVDVVQVPAEVGEDEVRPRLHLRLPHQAAGGHLPAAAAHLQRGSRGDAGAP